MPFTFNGIGTHYYGRSNLSVVEGACPACGRQTRLFSYDTREWFCFAFIPIVPLKRFRVVDDCSRCRRHRRIALADYQEATTTRLEPLRRRVESAGTVAAKLELARAQVELGQVAEATRALESARAEHPEDSEVAFALGAALEHAGRAGEAVPHFELAVAAGRPPEAALALGRCELHLGHLEEAVRALEEARRRDPSDPDPPWHLANALMGLDRASEAFSRLEEVKQRAPDYASSNDFLELSKRCKKKLGYDLTPEEKRATKKRRSGAAAYSGSIRWARIGAILGIGGVVIAGSLAAWGYWKAHHVEVYLDNDLGAPVAVTVDDARLEVPPGPPTKVTLAPGQHWIAIEGGDPPLARIDARIDGESLIDAVTEDRFFVASLGGRHVYRRAEIGYSANPSGQTYRETLIGMSSFFEVRGVDYAFRAAPEELSMSSDRSRIVKVAFGVAADLDLNQYAVIRWGEGRREEAEKALLRALEIDPCSYMVRDNLATVLEETGRSEEYEAHLRSWLQECPAHFVEVHRRVQDLRIGRGDRAAVVSEYRELVSREPEVAAHHYLLGRLLIDPEVAIAEYRRALALDPEMMRARAALGHDLLALERDAEASEAFAQVVKAEAAEPGYLYLLAATRISSGDLDGARALAKAAETPAEIRTEIEFLVAAAAGDEGAGRRLVQAESRSPGAAGEGALQHQLRLEAGRCDPEAVARIVSRPSGNEVRERVRARARLELALARGQFEEAAELATAAALVEEETEGETILGLYSAAAKLAAGDREGAEAALVAIEREDPDTEPTGGRELEAGRVARALLGRNPEGELSAWSRESFERQQHGHFLLGLLALGQGDERVARREFARSRDRAILFDFPRFAATCLATAPGPS